MGSSLEAISPEESSTGKVPLSKTPSASMHLFLSKDLGLVPDVRIPAVGMFGSTSVRICAPDMIVLSVCQFQPAD